MLNLDEATFLPLVIAATLKGRRYMKLRFECNKGYYACSRSLKDWREAIARERPWLDTYGYELVGVEFTNEL